MNGVDLLMRSLAAPARKLDALLNELEDHKGRDPVGGADDADLISQICEDWLAYNDVDRKVILAALVALVHNSYIGLEDIEEWIDGLTEREPGHN
jgi:hypothetical protein